MARPRQVTDEQILDAARAVFVERGPGVPVAQVARRLGVTQAALFQRLGSKEQLLAAAFAAAAPPALRTFALGPAAGRPVTEQLVELLAGLAGFFARVLPGLVVLRAAGLPTHRTRRGQLPPPLAIRAALAGWLRRARPELPDPEAVSEALLGALEARAFNRHVGGASFAPGEEPVFIERLVRALLPERARPARRRSS
jgi:AcrR family transcriptional regulator